MMTYRDGTSELLGASREIDVLWITAGLGCDGDTIESLPRPSQR